MNENTSKGLHLAKAEGGPKLLDRDAEIRDAERRAWEQMSLGEKIIHRLAFFVSYFLYL